MDDIELRDGTTTEDRRLDRLVQFDERSRQFSIMQAVPATLRSRTYPCPVWLDQGQEGACVGFSMTHGLSTASRRKVGLAAPFARKVYGSAKKIDPWEGEDYEGTSVLAGAKVLKNNGFIESYRWAFGIDQVLAALSNSGPVVLGIPWKDSMFEPDPKTGLLDCSGEVIGGHAILARGHLMRHWVRGVGYRHVVRLRNSWGKDWGIYGDCFITVEDLSALLKQQGEACVLVGNQLQKVAFPKAA